MFKFKNGSFIKSIPSSKNNRGVRSSFYACKCFDLESDNNETVIVWLDRREPFGRFVPTWYFKSIESESDIE